MFYKQIGKRSKNDGENLLPSRRKYVRRKSYIVRQYIASLPLGKRPPIGYICPLRRE